MMQLQESGEMYLETILILSEKLDVVRAIDVGRYMGFSRPSVSRALGLLKEGGYVAIDSNSHLQLTEKGKQVADDIYDKHTWLAEFLTGIGVDKEKAVEDACKIEHYISDESFAAIKRQVRRRKRSNKEKA